MYEFVMGLVFKTRITATDESISGKSTFKSWSYPRTTVAGYRLDNKTIRLYDAYDNQLESISNDTGSGEFIGWLKDNYPDFDKVAREKEEQEIFANEAFGQDEGARVYQYRLAKKIVYGLTGSAIAILVVGFFSPHEWQLLLFACAAVVPLLATFFYRKYKGLVRIFSTKGGAYPALWGAYLASIIYFLTCFTNHHTLDSAPLSTYIAVVAVVLIALFFAMARDTIRHEKRSTLLMAGMVVYWGLMAYWAVAGANCVYDVSEPAQYNVEVIKTRKYKGSKSTNYYMMLQPWGPVKSTSELSISSSSYAQLSAGDTIVIALYPGALGMQWYTTDK